MKLGADVYIDSKAKNSAEELQKLGGARVIIATAPDSGAMAELIGGLGPNGRLVLVGVASDPIGVAPVQLDHRIRVSIRLLPVVGYGRGQIC
jgi:D-arabinose 1-dehydrogenase-like Zn-dependent alcohol dehydrogenase